VGEIAGGEKVLLSLINHLPKWNVEPILACMRPGPLAEVARHQGIEVYEFQNHRYRDIHLVWKGIQWLARVIRDADIQLVHANHAAHIYSSLATRITKIPEVWHIHDYPYHWDWVDQLLIRLPTNHVIFTTNKVKSGYSLLHACQNSVIYPSCIDPFYLRTLTPQSDIRAKYNLPLGPLFLTVTRLQEHKGQRYLLNAIPAVLSSYPDAVFAIVGKPSGLEQERYMYSLSEQARQLGIQDQVKFLGYVSEKELVSLYSEALTLVHPAITESFGLVLLEAMALGVPVIAAAADGPNVLIKDGQTGLLVPTSDSESLAKAMIRILNEAGLVKVLGKAGIGVAENYQVEKMIERTVDIYRCLVS
jgi:glycosyltransferase involved in cell wall biosynthesis